MGTEGGSPDLKTCKTLVDAVRARAAITPNATAYTFLVDGERPAESWTYQQLDERARAIAAELQSVGSTDDRVLLLFAPGLDYIAAFFGCLYAGRIAVPAYPPDPRRLERSLQRLLTIAADCQATS